MKKNLVRFGTKYSGFYYPKDLDFLSSDSIIYCVGVGEDISHDLAIANKLSSNLYLFDPTPRAIDHVSYIKKLLLGEDKVMHNKRFGGGDPNYLDLILNNRIHADKIFFYEYAISTHNKIMKFYEPSNPEFVSHSLVKEMKTSNYIEVQTINLTSVMKELNHDTIDLLKLDIEGHECDVIEDMLDNSIEPKYLSVDFDNARTGKKDSLSRYYETLSLLEKKGYKLLDNSNYDCSFILGSVDK